MYTARHYAAWFPTGRAFHDAVIGHGRQLRLHAGAGGEAVREELPGRDRKLSGQRQDHGVERRDHREAPADTRRCAPSSRTRRTTRTSKRRSNWCSRAIRSSCAPIRIEWATGRGVTADLEITVPIGSSIEGARALRRLRRSIREWCSGHQQRQRRRAAGKHRRRCANRPAQKRYHSRDGREGHPSI